MLNKFKVAVVGGAGHIGLPLSCFISSKGYEVLIVDINEKTLNKIKNNEPPFFEEDLQKYLENANKNNLQTNTDLKKIKDFNLIIITLGTSSEQSEVDNFRRLVSEVIELASEESNLILRSTVSIEEIDKIKENRLLIKKNIKLFYCPERIAEGKSLKEIKELPQIIASQNQKEVKQVVEFFESLGIKTYLTSFRNAAFLKLFSNAYRYAEFTLVNEFFNIAEKNNIDFKEIIELAKVDYPRLMKMPSYGFVGGPCLIKDTKTFIDQYSNETSVLASLQESNNEFMQLIIKKCLINFPDKKFIQLGMTFKPNSDDLRSSLAYKLYKMLVQEGFKIYPVDLNLKPEDVDFKLFNYEEVIDNTDNILITTNHKFINKLNLSNKKVITVGYK
jgi:UDP-N-acetyl-D-mannosaminuronic acid dehydrogenase